MIKYKVVSDSMSPLISIGDLLEIEEINEQTNLRKFDILVFKLDNKLICHYFWHENKVISSGEIITKSLKNHEEDLPFKRSDIIGRVTNFKIGPIIKIKLLFRYFLI